MLHTTVDYYPEHLLRENAPEERISARSFHSFRIGFACALLAANCPYDMIQALARWRSDKSVAIYARLNPSEYSGWVTKVMQQTTTSRTVARMGYRRPRRGRHLPVGRVLLSRGGRWRGR